MKKLSFGILLLLGAFAWGADRPAIHGMLIFGKDTIYLSHLPMFHQPHDYQVIVEATLETSAQQIYLQDRASHPEQLLYTIEPLEKFVLPDEMQNLKSFQATLFRGHFERGGVPIAENISIKVTSVVYFNHFDPQAAKPDTLTYLLFGHPGEQYLAHWIVAKPDFDQIASVEFDAYQDQAQSSKQPYRFALQTGYGDDKPLEDADASIQVLDGSASDVFHLISFKEIYLEFDDLSD
jgi:hypothetical protein